MIKLNLVVLYVVRVSIIWGSLRDRHHLFSGVRSSQIFVRVGSRLKLVSFLVTCKSRGRNREANRDEISIAAVPTKKRRLMCFWPDIAEVQGYEKHYVNAWLKRCVFNLDLNGESVSEPWTLSGRLIKSNQIKSNQITFIVTSSQHMCLDEWNSWERAPDSAEQLTYRQYHYILTDLYRWQCAIYTYIYSVHTVYC